MLIHAGVEFLVNGTWNEKVIIKFFKAYFMSKIVGYVKFLLT